MKRDMDLMLEILAYIEECPDVPVKTLTPKNFLSISNDLPMIWLHLELLHDAGFIEWDGLNVGRMTMAGYDYLYSKQSKVKNHTT